jgi:hypothetical protein
MFFICADSNVFHQNPTFQCARMFKHMSLYTCTRKVVHHLCSIQSSFPPPLSLLLSFLWICCCVGCLVVLVACSPGRLVWSCRCRRHWVCHCLAGCLLPVFSLLSSRPLALGFSDAVNSLLSLSLSSCWSSTLSFFLSLSLSAVSVVLPSGCFRASRVSPLLFPRRFVCCSPPLFSCSLSPGLAPVVLVVGCCCCSPFPLSLSHASVCSACVVPRLACHPFGYRISDGGQFPLRRIDGLCFRPCLGFELHVGCKDLWVHSARV